MNEFLIIVVIAGLLLALVGGYYLATHQHQLATQTAQVIVRATTIPSGDVATLNAKVDGLGSTLQNVATAVGAKTADGVTTIDANNPPKVGS